MSTALDDWTPQPYECHRCHYHTKVKAPPRTCPSCGHPTNCKPRCDRRTDPPEPTLLKPAWSIP